MKSLILLSLFLLTACDALYYKPPLPQGMVVTESHYTDAQELAAVCGDRPACVWTNYTTTCDMHLPLEANGDPMHREHEITHCGGRRDPPTTRVEK